MNDTQRIVAALAATPTTPTPPGRPDSDVTLGQTNQNPEGISFLALLREDWHTHERDFFSQGFWAVAVHRFGNWRMGLPRWVRPPFSVLYKVLYKCVEWTCGISLAYTVKVGRRLHLWHHGGMILGAREIGNDVHVRQNTTFGVVRTGDPRWLKPTIGHRADIGTGAVIVGGITVGHDSVVGANAVVTKDVPANHIAAGVPAVNRKRGEKRQDPLIRGEAEASGLPPTSF